MKCHLNMYWILCGILIKVVGNSVMGVLTQVASQENFHLKTSNSDR